MRLERSGPIFCTFCFFAVTSIVGVEIRQMEVPSVIESGSHPYVILDCNYDIADQEGRHVDVKWFFGNDPQPFYQWIPGRRPQTRGELFENRLDLTYSIRGAHRFKKHRALKIIRPTTELSGMYRCKVSSLMDEDFMQKKMIVYSPASDVSLIYTKPDSRTINLTCSATGVYPQPEVKLSWGPHATERGETTTLTVERDGLFDVSVHKILDEELLRPETIFGCLVSIPGTAYSIREETMYFPGKVLYQITANSSPIPQPATSSLVLLWLAFIASSSLLGLNGLHSGLFV